MGSILPITTGPMSRPDRVDSERTSTFDAASPAGSETTKTRKLRKAANDFESLFMHQLLKNMRASIPKSTEHDQGMETMRDVTDQKLAIHLAHHGGIGLGDMVFEALQAHRETTPEQPLSRRSGEFRSIDHSPIRIRPLSSDSRIQREDTGN